MNLHEIEVSGDVQDLIERALKEDIGEADVTSEAIVGEHDRARAYLLSRGPYVLSGLTIAERVFHTVDPSLAVKLLREDTKPVSNGDCVMTIEGKARSILAAERTALNFLQRMTGVASLTRQLVEKAAKYGVKILDTRKTTPTLRILEKYAVYCGGGENHRMGLFDRVLIKDNHITFWRDNNEGTAADAVRAAREKFPHLQIEIEVESIEDLKEALKASPDWVLLDNMQPTLLRQCVELCKGKCRTEASGNIRLDTVEIVAQTGVDAISVGFLTHSAPAADLSLEFIRNGE
ncbi:MAG: carboxylating nicotinate-nucleotide diphosphorylase [Lentisphaerota bacterium]